MRGGCAGAGCGLTHTNRPRASDTAKVASQCAPSASLLTLTADVLRLVGLFPQALSTHPVHRVGQPIAFVPYI